jgi:hypothetical protein
MHLVGGTEESVSSSFSRKYKPMHDKKEMLSNFANSLWQH